MMKCAQAERKILLARSSELSDRALEQLKEHLAECEHCRKHRDQVDRIVSAAQQSLPAGEPDSAVIARIRSAAEKKTRPRKIIIFRRPVMQALAYAAALALFVGGWFMLPLNNRAQRINEINTILAIVSENDLPEMEYDKGPEGEQGLRELANRLLLMEGLAADELTELEFTDSDSGTVPTALRSRSIAGPQPKKCV